MQLKVKRVTDKFTESMYVLANEPSIALYRLQEHVRRSLPELVQHKTDMQSWEEQSQGAIYTVEYACSAVKSMTNSSLYFKNIDGLLRQAISLKEQISSSQGRSAVINPNETPAHTSVTPWIMEIILTEKDLWIIMVCIRMEEKSTALGCENIHWWRPGWNCMPYSLGATDFYWWWLIVYSMEAQFSPQGYKIKMSFWD